jgi:DNA-binding SARP family transcriptional activator
MEKILKIKMFGEFSIAYDGKEINDQGSRSKKLWTLLEYLVTFREREVYQSELIDLLWPDGDVENPANTLKTLLHRVRSTVSEIGIEVKDLIQYRRGAYSWNTSIPQVVDTDVFEAYYQEAYSFGISEEEKRSKPLAAAELYKGGFLPKNSLEPWVVPISTYYHGRYLKVVCDAAESLESINAYDEIVSLCQKAANLDPYEEGIHQYLIRALMQTGRQQKAQAHYEYVNQLFFTKFGITPSKETTALYKEIIKSNKSAELDLGIIKEDLKESEAKGAFFCEYEIFKDIYRLEARSAVRTGQTVYLGLLTITDAQGSQPELKLLNRYVDRLQESIVQSVRRGDVYTRFSVSQFLVMLPTTSFENGKRVMERICHNFRSSNPKAAVILKYSLQPMCPVEL